MVIGDNSKLINSGVLKIFRGTQELKLLTSIHVTTDVPNTRTNSRDGPDDSFTWRRRELSFTVNLTKDLLTLIQLDNTLSAELALTYQDWKIEGLALNGQSGDNITQTISAAVIHLSYDASETGWTKTNIKLLEKGQIL